jgi:hypothetical protein
MRSNVALAPLAGRGWREAPGEGSPLDAMPAPHPPFGHLLPAKRGEGHITEVRR